MTQTNHPDKNNASNPFCVCGDFVDPRCPVHVGVFDEATRYDSDADEFTRGTIPAYERIASRKLAQGSTNPNGDLDTFVQDLLFEPDGSSRITDIEEVKARIQEYITLALIDELTVCLAEVPMPSMSYEQIQERLAALQRDSQPGERKTP